MSTPSKVRFCKAPVGWFGQGVALAALTAVLLLSSGCTIFKCPPRNPGSDGGSSCFERRAAQFDAAACRLDCQARPNTTESACGEICAEARQRFERLARARCFQDEDGDGIQDPGDACPDTPASTRVNSRGCPDDDDDGITDADDACPASTPGQLVDLRGCETEIGCHEGQCEHDQPKCATEEECDRLTETPLQPEVPRDILDDLIRRTLGRRAHDLLCPADDTPPPQPALLSPGNGINPIEVGRVSVTLLDGAVVDADTIPISLEWQEVEDACLPVTYSVYIETYHCHSLPGLIEPASYRNRGWCRWMPYLYESLSVPRLDLDLPLGELLYDIHVPFIPELGWNPDHSGAFPVRYMPFWLRVRVIAHDGNGTSSAFDLHGDTRFLVLYADEQVPLRLLNEIPVAP